ncbi:Hsp20/alpha crystallin family protein [Oxalobacteraceae bacterium CAVE-383]|nr:Hsp20/alpha crystallin family protein [Oxalobacteraceae bacterium CAVE-383]
MNTVSTQENKALSSQPQQAASDDLALTPPVDVLEDANGITLIADLPGVPKDKLQLNINVDTLTIEAELDLALPGEMQSSHAEVGLNRYKRSFTLSKELDTEKVTADLANGVLKIRIPKAAHAQPRRIEIGVG